MIRVACSEQLHVLEADEFVVRTSGDWALKAAHATACDADAQRWLGWQPEVVRSYEPLRNDLLNRVLDDGPEPADPHHFALVGKRDRRIMGFVVLARQGGRFEMGGCLAPQYRGQGLGAQLFTFGAILAHEHLGLSDIYAGAEVGNIACRGSLLKAGFTPANGPAQHTLPDGRVISSLWFKSTVARGFVCGPGRCRPRWWPAR
ncbi:GNAT family N-acetyltransferase [Nonomuraea insulae]|uniref:GNAT family N-acetyltransferase n=1 Tax=Nonomuraea insulae TaxID=1616787 RepID=A0ABW1CMJ2_9ACTN